MKVIATVMLVLIVACVAALSYAPIRAQIFKSPPSNASQETAPNDEDDAETEIESNDTRVAALNEQLSAAGRQIDALNAAIIRLLADAGI